MIHRLSGVMVDGGDWEEDALTSGALTDCEALAKAIAEDDENDLTLEINSFGGSVEGGKLVSMALRNWCLSHLEGTGRIRVGALAASAAANLIATAPEMLTIEVYPESEIMYHSCSGMVAGSPGMLKDAAEHMTKINDRVIRALMRRTDLEEQDVVSWFEDGREGWLTGEEAYLHGLAGKMLEGIALEEPTEPSVVNYPVEARIAANFFKLKSNYKGIAMEDEDKKELVEETKAEETPQETPQDDEKPTETASDEENKPEDTEVAEGDEKPEEGGCEAEGEPAEDIVKKENEELKKEVESLKQELAQLKQEKAMLTKGLGTTVSVKAGKGWLELVKEIPNGLSVNAYSAKYEALKKEHATEFKAYMDSHQNR